MSRISWIGSLLLVLFVAGLAMAQPRAGDINRIRPSYLIADPAPLTRDHWLGVQCLPVPPAVRAQLNLPENQGVLIEDVVPDSPAAKAGIVQYDLLVRAGDKVLTEPRDLIQAVSSAKDEKLSIELIHGGQHKTIQATLAKRPEDARHQIGVMPTPGDWETMQKWLEHMQATPGSPGGPMHFRVWRPGAIVPPNVIAGVETPLPPNMNVVISKEGSQPAKIVVKRDDEKWEVTETELDKLPADVRPHVEQMLGRNLLYGTVLHDAMPVPPAPYGRAETTSPAPMPEPANPPRGAIGALEDRLDKRLEAMERRIDKLVQAMEDARQGRAPLKAPDEHGEK